MLIKNKKIKVHNLFILLFVLSFSCSPKVQLNRSFNKINKLLTKYPELKSSIDTSLNNTSDSSEVLFNLDTIINIDSNDSIFISNIDSLIFLNNKIEKLNDSIKSKELIKNKNKIINNLKKANHLNGDYNIDINVKVESKDTIIFKNFNLDLKLNNGILKLKSDTIKIKTLRELKTVNINYNKYFTFFNWIKDFRTLFLIFLILILLIFLAKR
jgi:hypothetical protein